MQSASSCPVTFVDNLMRKCNSFSLYCALHTIKTPTGHAHSRWHAQVTKCLLSYILFCTKFELSNPKVSGIHGSDIRVVSHPLYVDN